MKENIEKAEKLSWPPTGEELEKQESTKEFHDFLILKYLWGKGGGWGSN